MAKTAIEEGGSFYLDIALLIEDIRKLSMALKAHEIFVATPSEL